MTYLIASLLKSRISNFKSIIKVGRTGPFLFIVLRYCHTHIATPTIFLLSPGQISPWIRPCMATNAGRHWEMLDEGG